MIGFTEFRAGIRTQQVNKTYHTFFSTQPIFIKQSARTSYLFEANVHLKVTPQYAVVSTQVRTNIVFRIWIWLGLLRKTTTHCRKTLR